MNAGRQNGFTYVGFLIAVAVTGAGLAAFAEIASHAMQREKEAELLFRGNEYREGIAAYHKLEGRYPRKLEDLLENKGFSMPVRHLRRLYRDPMTGEADWVVMQAPDGSGVMGVHSRSERAPIKTGNFLPENGAFEAAERYSDWKFVHSPAAK
jgi:type II secretory pathway pseudopilin PulG